MPAARVAPVLEVVIAHHEISDVTNDLGVVVSHAGMPIKGMSLYIFFNNHLISHIKNGEHKQLGNIVNVFK